MALILVMSARKLMPVFAATAWGVIAGSSEPIIDQLPVSFAHFGRRTWGERGRPCWSAGEQEEAVLREMLVEAEHFPDSVSLHH